MGKHTKTRYSRFTLNLLSRRRSLLTILYTALMVLFITYNWIILSVIFAGMAIFELFLAVETAAAEAAIGKEQEIAMAGLAQLQSGETGENNLLHSLFNFNKDNKETKEEVKKAANPQAFNGYL